MKTRKQIKEEETTKGEREIHNLEQDKQSLKSNHQKDLESLDEKLEVVKLRLEGIKKIK